MMKRYLILFLLFSLPLLVCSQTAELAKMDDESISIEEFRMRFELTPRIGSSTNIDTQKTHFLYTLLAEKLWAKEARYQGLDTSYAYQQYVLNLEKMLVRDALFKQEILSKIKIDEKEIIEGIRKKRQRLYFKFLFSDSKEEIEELYNKLEYTSIDTLLKDRPEKLEQSDPISVDYGQLDEEIENIVYRLNENQYTAPVEQEIGWVIYYLVGKVIIDESATGDLNSLRSDVTEIIDTRKRKYFMQEYLSGLMEGTNVNADGKLFKSLTSKLHALVQETQMDENFKSYILYEQELLRLINNFSISERRTEFIKFDEDPISLNEFLYYLYFNNFFAADKDLQSVSASLNKVVKDFIRYEIISREAYKKNFNMSAEVKNELKTWEDNFLSQYLRNTFNSKARVTQAELDQFLSEQNKEEISAEYVSITEFIFDNLDEIQSIFSQLQFNYNLDEIIKNMNIKPKSIITNDDPKPLYTFGDLAEIIENMKVGEVYGPIINEKGYSVIKLNEKIEKKLNFQDKNSLQVESQKDYLFYNNLSRILNDETIQLAKKYDIRIDEKLLENIKVTEIPTMIYRKYGFGGQTVASPFLNLFYKWYEKYQQEKEAL